ncbi:hypothetical protein Tco_0642994 [Tanacetum coccineum]
MVKPEIRGNVNFEIKSQFMREMREYTFAWNKNDYAYETLRKRILDIVSLFNILGVTHDAVMLCVFPITLTRAAKRYCPPSKMTKQLEEIHNFKREEAEHDEWLRKFQEAMEMNQKGHDEIIRNLETKVKALTRESLKQIEYFSVNSSLLDEEVQDEMEEDEEINNEAAQRKPTDQMATPRNP